MFEDVDVLTAFSAHCAKAFCLENLVALLEFREFKRKLRKKFKKTTKGKSPEPPSVAVVGGRSVATGDEDESVTGPLSILSVSVRSSSRHDFREPTPTTSGDSSQNEELFTMYLSEDTPHTSASVTIDQSRWDLRMRVGLPQLGARSGIIASKTLSQREKARALFVRYVAWDAPLSLNVAHEHRRVVTALLANESAVFDTLTDVQLLFLFDGVVVDVVANLRDAMLRFKRMQKTKMDGGDVEMGKR
jgi:hypothetical protein